MSDVTPKLLGRIRRIRRAPHDYELTDGLSRFVLQRPAAWLAEDAAEAGVAPNVVTFAGLLVCLLTAALFALGLFWSGIAAGLIFSLLDRVDGELARRTGQASEGGAAADRAIDLFHPPLWAWGWAHGLAASPAAPEPVLLACLFWVLVASYALDRFIEHLFRRRHGVDIHAWRPIDSRFRLVAASRNPNLLLLAIGLAAGRPDVGLEAVVLWSMLTVIYHALRLAQANARADRGRKIIGWKA